MKRMLLLLLFTGGIILYGQAQTYYGTGAGNTGLWNTAVGYYAGHDITGNFNASFGFYAGRYTTSGAFNTFNGAYSGLKNTTGAENTFVGGYSGRDNSSGSGNTFLGYSSGFANTYGSNNVMIGKEAGYFGQEGNNNVMIGMQAGYNNATGSSNVYIGYQSGYQGFNSAENTFMGYRAGFNNRTRGNTFIGYTAGYQNYSGIDNVFMGKAAGYNNSSGSSNVYIGRTAGVSNVEGSNNVFLGHEAGYYERGSNKLYIAGNKYNTLLYGDFVSKNLAVGTVINSSYKLYVAGDAYTTGIWLSSDRKWKTDEKHLEGALAVIQELQPKSYHFRQTQAKGAPQFSEGKHYGFIAQELQNIIPELVREDTDGSLAVNYIEIIPLLMAAIKELDKKQQQVSSYEKRIQNLESQMKQMQALLEKQSGVRFQQDPSLSQSDAALRAFPNPSSGDVTVAYRADTASKDIQLVVSDLQGKIWETMKGLQPGQVTISLRDLNLPAGIYNITLVENGGITKTTRLLVK